MIIYLALTPLLKNQQEKKKKGEKENSSQKLSYSLPAPPCKQPKSNADINRSCRATLPVPAHVLVPPRPFLQFLFVLYLRLKTLGRDPFSMLKAQ